MPEPEAGGNKNHFTEAELAELNKEFPYASEEKIRDILESNEYLTINDSMLLESSQLRKDTAGKTDRYYYSAYLKNMFPQRHTMQSVMNKVKVLNNSPLKIYSMNMEY